MPVAGTLQLVSFRNGQRVPFRYDLSIRVVHRL